MLLCSNPKKQYEAYHEEINSAVSRVLNASVYILGEEVATFEREFAQYIGTADAVGVANGTDALVISLRALGIGPGDEVITVSSTALATVMAVVISGATPVLVDIDNKFYTMDVAQVEKAITPKTKAIIVVHLYGQSADMDALSALAKKHKLKLIEDCAQSTGGKYGSARLGSIGDVACFSFYPTKNLGGIGDGGMIVSNDKELIKNARQIREYGWDANRVSQRLGINSRLDVLQAAILRVKLKYLDKAIADRIRVAELYNSGLASTGWVLPVRRENTYHAFHLYVIRGENRDALIAHLKQKNIFAGVHYRLPVHREPSLQNIVRLSADLKVSETLAGEVVSLPMYPELKSDEVQMVIDAVLSFK